MKANNYCSYGSSATIKKKKGLNDPISPFGNFFFTRFTENAAFGPSLVPPLLTQSPTLFRNYRRSPLLWETLSTHREKTNSRKTNSTLSFYTAASCGRRVTRAREKRVNFFRCRPLEENPRRQPVIILVDSGVFLAANFT